ncbi:hypothetical protein [Pseudomonas sp. ABFPK]|uniref:hypothetical protein n=1 Tax=Pseudomonas sp. ABFPK TaxID=1636605 RepID=UPI000A8C41B6|nr:hypothetical protein [Pseudomonas sp. ABFPK]
MSSDFINRTITYIELKDQDIEVVNPQFAVLIAKTLSGKNYLDVGAFCYRKRSNIVPNRTGCPVVADSIDPSRITFVRNLIEHLKSFNNGITVVSKFGHIKSFISWIDSQYEYFSFNNPASLKEAYRNYTNFLLHRMRISGLSGQQIKAVTAAKYQAQARMVVMLASDVSEPEILASTTVIKKSRKEGLGIDIELPSSDTQSRTFAALINYLDEAHRVLVEGGKFPMILISPDDETYYLYSLLGATTKANQAQFSPASLLVRSPTFPSWHDTINHFNLSGRNNLSLLEKGIYDKSHQRFKNNNENLRSELRRRIGNHAIVAGMTAFMAATGCNLSVAQNLKVDTLNIVPSTQGKRFSGTKGRANGKEVYPEFGAQFAPIFKTYLKLRLWVLNGEKSDLIFPIASLKHEFKSPNRANITCFRSHLLKALPKTTWVISEHWRKNVSFQYVKLSGGDLTLTAEKLGNNESTVKDNYCRPSLEDYAREMSTFFASAHQAAIDRTRSTPQIPVNFIDHRKPETTTGVGSCEKRTNSKPERAQGFTSFAPEPSCRAPENCLFCTFYAVHADEMDIRRLLSLRFLIDSANVNRSSERWTSKFGPIIHRIDEILSAIRESGSASDHLVDTIHNQVTLGALDPFWSIHFDAMVITGVVS